MIKIKKISNFSIKDLPLEDRPQEKMFIHGADFLSNAELLALIIRTGNKERTSVEVSQEILNHFKDDNNNSLLNLKEASIKELMEIKGIGKSKAAMIMAAITLSKRINKANFFEKKKVLSPRDIVDFIREDMKSLKVEEFRIVNLNTKKEIESVRLISKGIINATIVHPREVFKCAINERAHSIILLHNHPSKDPTPSKEDVLLTKKLRDSGEILSIPVIDHIIIGGDNYYSFLENKRL